MTESAERPRPRLFISYAHADESDGRWKTKLLPTLRALRTGGKIDFFEDDMIEVGDEWDDQLRRELDNFDLIVFLVSTAFLASGYIETVEVKRALERHEAKEAHILPILVKPCDWTYRNWAKVQAFPRYGPDARPLSFWEKQGELDEGLLQISERIRAWAAGWQARNPAPAPRSREDMPTTQPYRGLFAFESENKDDFFGRADLTDTLWGTISTNRLTLLTGASGSGKSSLLNAGIIPRLDTARWCIARSRPGEAPIDNLARAIAAPMLPAADTFTITHKIKQIAAALTDQPTVLLDYARTHKEQQGTSLFLILDQFEETYNLAMPNKDGQHERLIDLLLAIAGSPPDGPVTALLAMRADFQPALQDDRPELVDALQGASVMMRRMTVGELAEAIEGPARRRGVAVESGLLARLTGEVLINPDALPLLELTLETLWSSRADGPLTLAAYEHLDGLAGALAARAEAVLADPTIDEQKLRRLLLELVHIDLKGGIDTVTRQPRTKTYLDDLDPILWGVGEKLAAERHRLLVIARNDTLGADTLDLTHEALFRRWDKLAKWIEDERGFLLFRQRLDERIIDIDANRGDPGYYLPKIEIARAQEWLAQRSVALQGRRTDFISASAHHWLEDAADDEAKMLWACLDLLRGEDGVMHEYNVHALVQLRNSNGATRSRFLKIATTDRDAARKFNRAPELVLHSAIGLDPKSALDLASPVLNDRLDIKAVEPAISLLTLKKHMSSFVSPDYKLNTKIAMEIATKTLSVTDLKIAVQAISYWNYFLQDDESNTVVKHLMELAFIKHDSKQVEIIVQAIPKLVDRMDEKAAQLIAIRLNDLAANYSRAAILTPIIQTIRDIFFKLTKESAAFIAHRIIEFTTNNTSKINLPILAEAITAIAEHVDNQTAALFANYLIEVDPKNSIWVFFEAFAALSDKIEVIKRRQIAQFIVEGVIRDAFNKNDYVLGRQVPVKKVITAVANLLSYQAIQDTFKHSVALYNIGKHTVILTGAINALAEKIDCQQTELALSIMISNLDEISRSNNLVDVAETIAHFVGKLDESKLQLWAKHILSHALETTNNIESSFGLLDTAKIIAAVAAMLDTSDVEMVENYIVDRATLLAASTVALEDLENVCNAITVLRNVFGDTIREKVAYCILERAISVILQLNNPYELHIFSKVIIALRDEVSGHTAERVIGIVVRLAARSVEEFDLRDACQVILGLVEHLPTQPTLLTCIEFLKLPYGGDPKASASLIESIAYSLNRPDLLRPFPEQSFWAVMQHLAELKAANPDWDWLDLARPPLPPNELVATFRRLCADPPAWQTA